MTTSRLAFIRRPQFALGIIVTLIMVLSYVGCFLLVSLDSALSLSIMGSTPVTTGIDWEQLSAKVFVFDGESTGRAVLLGLAAAAAIWISSQSHFRFVHAIAILLSLMLIIAVTCLLFQSAPLRWPFMEVALLCAIGCTDQVFRRQPVQPTELLSVPTLLGLLVVCSFSGLVLSKTALSPRSGIPLVLAIILICGSRVYYLRRRTNGRRTLLAHLMFVAVFVSLSLVLLSSYLEYTGGNSSVLFAPPDQPWRGLYFSFVVAIFVLLPCIWAQESTISTKRKSIVPIVLTSSMAVGIPLLTCFTPHGVFLLLVSTVWLAIAYCICRHRYRSKPQTEPAAVRFWCIVIVILLFGLLAADRLAYYSILRSVAPTMPVLALLPPVIAGIWAVFGLFSDSVKTQLKRTQNQLRTAIRNPRPRLILLTDLGVLASCLVMLSMYVVFHAIVLNSLDPASVIPQPTLGVPSINSFFGLNALSWASVAYLVDLSVLGVALLWSGVRSDRAA